MSRRMSWASNDSKELLKVRGPEEWDMTLPPDVASKEEVRSISLKVLRALDEDWPRLKNSSLLGTWKERDRIIRSFGPPMLLLHWVTLAELGRIPHSSEGRGITLPEAAELAARSGRRFFIEMFSHRWHRPDYPDNERNCKAYSLVEWAKYRWSLGMDVFFWIDYTCINQFDILPGVTMLPLYVSSCNNILCYDTPDYENRAWCRLERLMFAAFVAPNNEFLEPDFIYDKTAEHAPNGELLPAEERHQLLPDPDDGQLSMVEDKGLIHDLKELCAEHWAKCWKDGLLDAVESKAGQGRHIRCLEFGKTKVRMRRFHNNRQSSSDGNCGWKNTDKYSQSSTEASDEKSRSHSPSSQLGISPHTSFRSDMAISRHGSALSWWDPSPGWAIPEPAQERTSGSSGNAWWPFCCSTSTRCCAQAESASAYPARMEGISATTAFDMSPINMRTRR